MADKQIVFSDQEKKQIEAIVIDKDKEEAIKFLAGLVQRFKGTPKATPAAPKEPSKDLTHSEWLTKRLWKGWRW